MASPAVFAQGTFVQIETSTNNYETIAQLKSIDGPSFDTDDLDVTTHDGSQGFHEYIPGLKEGGELSFDINFVPDLASHSAASGVLSRYMEDGQDKLHNFRLTFPDASSASGIYWTFPGYVKGFGITAPVDDVLGASVTIKVAGRPTLA